MQTENIKSGIAAQFQRLKNYLGSPVAVVLGIAVLIFGITVFQRACDRRAIENQTAQIAEYEAQTKESQARTEQLLQMFDNQHQSTLAILDAMKTISGTINNLVANDRAFETQVNDLKQNYESSKNPNVETKTNAVRRARRRNLPIERREDDLLADDKQLYPDSSGN